MDANRRAILRRRMMFLGGALASLPGCDKSASPPPQPTVNVEQPDPTPPTPTPSPEPVPSKMGPRPDTAIPETSCKEDRDELLRLRKVIDGIYDEQESIYTSIPTCAVTDDACVPRHQPLAQRVARLHESINAMVGLCGCPAPIVDQYISKHSGELHTRLGKIRERIVATAGVPAAGDRWDELVQNEATPHPCLSCVMCEPKSACD